MTAQAPDTSRANAPTHPNTPVWHAYVLIGLFVLLDTLRIAFTSEKTTFLLKEQLHLSASAVTTLNLLLFVPQYLQPFMGAGAELYPLFGYRRRSYFALGALLSAAALLALARLYQAPLAVVIALLLLTVAGFSLRTVLFNASLVALGNRVGNYNRLQSFQAVLALALTTSFAGQLAGHVTERWSYPAAYIAGALSALSLVALIPLIDEPHGIRQTDGRVHPSDRMSLQAALRAALGDRGLWVTAGFIAFIGFTPFPATAQTYYFTDALHFSKELVGQLQAWSAGGSLLGIALFQFFPRRAKLRLLALTLQVTNLCYYIPWLLIHNSLSARVMLLVAGTVGVWGTLSQGWLMARACTSGVEATIFGLLVASHQIFYYICDWIGSHLYDWFGPAAHHTITFGWMVSVGVGLVSCLPGFLFLPFLPRVDPADRHLTVRTGATIGEQ